VETDRHKYKYDKKLKRTQLKKFLKRDNTLYLLEDKPQPSSVTRDYGENYDRRRNDDDVIVCATLLIKSLHSTFRKLSENSYV